MDKSVNAGVRERFAILDFSPAGAFVLDADYRVLFWNKCLELWTNVPGKDILGLDIRVIYPRLAENKFAFRLENIFQGGPPAIFSAQIHQHLIPAYLPDGRTRLQHCVVTAVRDHDRTLALFTLQDVTDVHFRLKEYFLMRDQALKELAERKKAEEALSKSEERFRRLVENATDAFYLCDGSGAILDINQSACESLGYGREELLKLRMSQVDVSSSGDAQRAVNSSLQPLDRFRVEGLHRRKDGSTFPVDLSVSVFEQEGRRFFLSLARDITTWKNMENQLRELATTDGLTGLYNRRHFMDLAEKELLRSKRYGHAFSIIMFDIDHFKEINDTLGHSAGDEALRQLARTCRATLREIDAMGRLGGEEFGVALPESSADKAMEVAERLRQATSGIEIPSSGGKVCFTVSFGVAGSTDASDFESLLVQADKALYLAKSRGRNRVERHTADLDRKGWSGSCPEALP